MREASIHITERDLALVIKNIRSLYDIDNLSNKKLAKLLVHKAKGKSCNNRVIVVNSDRVEKKTNRLLKSSKEDTELLASIIHKMRIKKRHKGVSKITQDHRDWSKLKELVDICITFCNDFGFEKKQGFVKYVDLGLDKISSFRNHIHKLVNMAETIANEYEAIDIINNDPNPEESKEIHDLYVSTISTKTGIVEEFHKKPLKYIHFIRVREITDELDIPSDIFIKAQFEGLAWASAFPDPHQLVGDKAMERLNKYLFENKIRKGKGDVMRKEDLKKGLLKLKRMK